MAISLLGNKDGLRARRELDRASSSLADVTERLSSGLRINNAADDSAGLAVASQLEAESRVYTQAVRNVSDGISYLSIAEAATDQLGGILGRLKELATQSANGTYSNSQRSALDQEATALQSEYSRILNTTAFNGTAIFSTAGQSLSLQTGYGSDRIDIDLSVGTTSTLVAIGAVSQVVTAGANPLNLKLSDINADGKLDLVNADASGSTVSYFVGNGNGTFGARNSLATISNTNAVDVADINGDGKADLVAGSAVFGRLFTFLGNGNGTFGASLSYFITGGLGNFVLGDLDGNGSTDVAWASNTGTFPIFLNNGSGVFAASPSAAVGGSPTVGGVFDLNGDGKADLLGTTGAGVNIVVALGNGNGTFKLGSTYALSGGASAQPVTGGDFDGDGIIDVFSLTNSSGAALFHHGNGNGTFAAPTTIATLSTTNETSRAVDLNNDGRLDILSVASGTTSILYGNGNGTFHVALSTSTPNAWGSATGDINGDGTVDFLLGSLGGTPNTNLTAFIGTSFSEQSTGQIQATAGISVATQSSALASLPILDQYESQLSAFRGKVGAALSRLSSTVNSLSTKALNLTAARDLIRDADLAQDSAEFVRLQILQNAAAAIAGQANQNGAIVTKLLQG